MGHEENGASLTGDEDVTKDVSGGAAYRMNGT
jgi:hypothetical protein